MPNRFIFKVKKKLFTFLTAFFIMKSMKSYLCVILTYSSLDILPFVDMVVTKKKGLRVNPIT